MNPRRLSGLLPLAVFGAVACGGRAFEGVGQGAGGTGGFAGTGSSLAGMGNVAGAVSSGGASSVAGSTNGGGSTSIAGSGNAAGSGGSAGLDLQACRSNSDCQIEPIACCSCGSGPITDYTAINTQYTNQYSTERCAPGTGCGCPVQIPDPNAPDLYFIATCRANRCVVVDLGSTDITTCKVASDCALRSGTACCAGCGPTVSLNASKESELAQLVCGGAPSACAGCVSLGSGETADCINGRCSVVLGTCTEAKPCP